MVIVYHNNITLRQVIEVMFTGMYVMQSSIRGYIEAGMHYNFNKQHNYCSAHTMS